MLNETVVVEAECYECLRTNIFILTGDDLKEDDVTFSLCPYCKRKTHIQIIKVIGEQG